MLHIYEPVPQATILTHFYNEEFLLPHWLKHHSKLFDHGILVNYASTDRSVEIIKELTPTWEIHDSVNQMFDAILCDKEIMEYERTVTGWKMVLNVTEFLFTNDLKEKLRNLRKNNTSMVRSIGYQINDNYEEEEFDNDKPLILQRFHGKIDEWRYRMIHCHEDGGYSVGRHWDTPELKQNPFNKTHYTRVPISDDNLYTFWYKFAPYKQQVPRKIQISPRIPNSDKEKKFGWQHWDLTEEILYKRWQEDIPTCHDVRNEAGIQKEYLKIKEMYEK
jgi:hypothetical protein